MQQNQNYTTLGAFFDDSNNLESSNPGIVAGAFSILSEDCEFRYFPKRIPLEDLCSWFKKQPNERQYRFARLTNIDLRKTPLFIPFFVPDLIKNYVSSCPVPPEKVCVFVDGIMAHSHKEYLRNVLSKDFNKVTVEWVVKREREMARRPKEKRIYVPRGLSMADILANSLCTGEYPPKNLGYNPEVKVDEASFLQLSRSL